jgi:hypothetical protein
LKTKLQTNEQLETYRINTETIVNVFYCLEKFENLSETFSTLLQTLSIVNNLTCFILVLALADKSGAEYKPKRPKAT